MDLLYRVVRSEIPSDDGYFIAYGIEVYDKNGEKLEGVYDISTDPFYVASICRLCTINAVSPIHLKDIIIDRIYSDNMGDG